MFEHHHHCAVREPAPARTYSDVELLAVYCDTPAQAAGAIDALGAIGAVFRATDSELRDAGLPSHVIDRIRCAGEFGMRAIVGRHVGQSFTSPESAGYYLTMRIGDREREVFAVLLLDAQHRLIECVELFAGTIDSASVHPREVVKIALQRNAAAMIIAHNHPSGGMEPSNADVNLTLRLKKALELVDVRLLDHFICTACYPATSLAQRGIL